MLKRFYSKRSGFTLVEIIVAFAVFAIMASMIAQILSLSISARNYNTQYARELAKQEKILTVVQKDKNQYNKVEAPDDPDIYKFNFTKNGTPLDPMSLNYQVKAADPAAENQAEGINYFLSPVDYECKNDGSGDPASPDDTGPSDGMAQTSRVDTRIAGTKGIYKITVQNVIKDPNTYPPESEFYLKPGQTRYFIEVAAATRDSKGQTFQAEDVPFGQYRLYFYSSDELDGVKCSVPYKDGDKEYTKKVYKEMPVLGCGLINVDRNINQAVESGLSSSNTSAGSKTSNLNHYTVQSLGGNSVRIGTPYSEKDGKLGVQFEQSVFTKFYVDFDGDPKLTTASFGHNGVKCDDGSVIYTACPQYEDEYNEDGTPTYEEMEGGAYHPSIYGAYMYTRKYKDASDTPDE